ncbi:MAG: CBS domain-containing protein [Actinobacteria bacterium]|nr:CBS domain-containing protein [Actinomycetota bacterium]
MAGDIGTAASWTQAGRCVNFTSTREEAAGKRIADVMVRRPKSLPVDATVGDVRRKLENPSLQNVVLLDGTAFAGLVDRAEVPADASDSAPARQFAASDVPTTTPDAPVPGVLAAMDAGQLSRLVVLDADGRTFAGLVCLDHTGEGFCGG